MHNSNNPRRCRVIGVLLFDRFSNHCLANAIEPLRAANRLGGGELYRWHFLTIDGAAVASSSGLPVHPEGPLAGRSGDYLFVLPSYGYLGHATPRNFRALRSAAQRFDTVVGMDTGGWLMAAAGLLEGRRATIHWDEYAAFSERFPDIDVSPRRVVIDGNRVTCGGTTTAFELVLQLVQEHHGADLRLAVAGFFMHGEQPDPDTSLPRFAGSSRIDAVVAIMRRSVEEPVGIATIARRVGVSQRGLELLFRARLGLTPQAVYRRLRLSEARRMLQRTDQTVAEIAQRCGYQNASAMTRAFRTEFGIPPTRHRDASRPD